MTSDSLITAEQLAELLGIPLQSVWRAARLGRIPSYKMGALWRFDLGEVLEALRQEAGTRQERASEAGSGPGDPGAAGGE